MDPILRPIPMPLLTERLHIRGPQIGDGYLVNKATKESLKELLPWMPWAQQETSPDESEVMNRRSMARWLLREDLWLLIFDKHSAELLGCTGLHRMNWKSGRFEIGYWVRTSQGGKGYIREATAALTRYAFEELDAKRVEIRCDRRNLRSVKVAESLGFDLEGVLRHEELDAAGKNLRDTCVYARLSVEGLIEVGTSWPKSKGYAPSI